MRMCITVGYTYPLLVVVCWSSIFGKNTLYLSYNQAFFLTFYVFGSGFRTLVLVLISNLYNYLVLSLHFSATDASSLKNGSVVAAYTDSFIIRDF